MFTFLSILIGYNAQKAFEGGSAARVNGAIIASLFVLGYNPRRPAALHAGIPPSATVSIRAAISSAYRSPPSWGGLNASAASDARQPRYDPHLGGDADHGRGDLYGDHADWRLVVYRHVVAVPAS